MNCQSCNTDNRIGILFCDNCGKPLGSIAPIGTKQYDLENGDEMSKGNWGTALFRKQLILHFQGATNPITVEIEDKLVMGRRDDGSEQIPDLDFMEYDAVNLGVSRRHSRIEHCDNTLTIYDMGSSNGTFLNGQRLAGNQPRVLRDGDEIRLGKLSFHIYFN